MKEILLEARFKNNRLLHEIQNQFQSISDFASKLNTSANTIYGLINLRTFPYQTAPHKRRMGAIIPIETARAICSFFDKKPEYLFPPDIYLQALGKPSKKNVVRIEVSLQQARIIAGQSMSRKFYLEDPTAKLLADERRDTVAETLDTLSDRERKILEMRFGLKGTGSKTLLQVAKAFGITRERVRQIESKAIRKLRHPKRARKLATVESSFDCLDIKQSGSL